MRISISGNISIEGISKAESMGLQKANQWPNPARQQAIQMNRKYFHLPELVRSWRWGDNQELILSRGYLDELDPDHVEDQRIFAPTEFPDLDSIELRPYQKNALDQVVMKDQGLLESPIGSGKSIMGLSLIHHCGQRSMILTHSKSLMYQWCDVTRGLMKIDPGMIGDGKWQEGEQMSVGMLQTLSNRGTETRRSAEGYGLVLVDECHHVPAATFSKVISWFPAFYRFGLSATPHRRDGLHELIHRSIGPTIAKVTPDEVQASGGIVPVSVSVIPTGFKPRVVEGWGNHRGVRLSKKTRYFGELVVGVNGNQVAIAHGPGLTAQFDSIVLAKDWVESLNTKLPDDLDIRDAIFVAVEIFSKMSEHQDFEHLQPQINQLRGLLR